MLTGTASLVPGALLPLELSVVQPPGPLPGFSVHALSDMPSSPSYSGALRTF